MCAQLFTQSQHPHSSLAGFTVAGLGVGCYRMGHKHADVLAHVLQGAVNVIDTSTTYLGGESESMIGQVLASPTFCDRRKEMVVVTKVGYLQGPLLAEAAALEAQNRLWPEVAKFHPQAWHCMHPSFIRHQLEASRARLKGPADIVLLHNPEFFFTSVLGEGGSKGPKPPSEDDHRQFYERLEAAFVALEQAADEGALSCYGLSTNPKGCRWSCSGLDNIWEATDIDRIMAAADSAARSLGRQEHRCRVIQMPLNLLEPDALVGPVKVLEQCKQHGLDVMTHRPINAIPPPGFHVGDWARRESFIKLRDRRPQPPALALIAAVCRSVLPDDDLAGGVLSGCRGGHAARPRLSPCQSPPLHLRS